MAGKFKLVAAGEDADFGKDAYRLSAIDEPPFYGMKMGGLALYTLDGVVVNDDYQVLDTDERPLEGLCSVGVDSGCCYAHTYPNFGAGTTAGRTATAGMLVGKALTEKWGAGCAYAGARKIVYAVVRCGDG